MVAWNWNKDAPVKGARAKCKKCLGSGVCNCCAGLGCAACFYTGLCGCVRARHAEIVKVERYRRGGGGG